jgi:hypothetical protein
MRETGERRSVASMGSHTTSTRSEVSALRCKSSSTAEAPRRQVIQVGDRRSSRRGPSGDLSKADTKAAKFALESVVRGSCPDGVKGFSPKYNARRTNTAAVTMMAQVLRFTWGLPKDDRQGIQRFPEGKQSSLQPIRRQSKAARNSDNFA